MGGDSESGVGVTHGHTRSGSCLTTLGRGGNVLARSLVIIVGIAVVVVAAAAAAASAAGSSGYSDATRTTTTVLLLSSSSCRPRRRRFALSSRGPRASRPRRLAARRGQCVLACVYVCARACVRACVRVCVRAFVRACASVVIFTALFDRAARRRDARGGLPGRPQPCAPQQNISYIYYIILYYIINIAVQGQGAPPGRPDRQNGCIVTRQH